MPVREEVTVLLAARTIESDTQWRTGQARDEAALEKPLQVEHEIEAPCAQRAHEARPSARSVGVKDEELVDGWVPRDERVRERPDDPSDSRARISIPHPVDERQAVHDVADRAQLYETDVLSRCAHGGSRGRDSRGPTHSRRVRPDPAVCDSVQCAVSSVAPPMEDTRVAAA